MSAIMRKFIFISTFSLWWLTTALAADPLGTLFFNPAQRQQLDQQRRLQRGETPEASPSEAPLYFNGLISRNGRPVATWVNGEKLPIERQRIDRKGNLVTQQGQANVQLRPGQTYQPALNQVQESYQRRKTE